MADNESKLGQEAANSVNIVFWIDGFRTQFTFRRSKAEDVVKVAEKMIDAAKDRGWEASWEEKPKQQKLEEAYEVKECDIHGEKMEKKYSKRKKKYYWVHFNEAGKPCFGTGYKD